MTEEELLNLIQSHDESEILDFKENALHEADKIGEYVSALGNSALLTNNPAAYLIWGVKDITKEIVGTKFDPYLSKTSAKTNMPLINKVESFVDPKLNLSWDKFRIQEKKIVVLVIDVTHVTRPIKYSGKEFIRIGTSNKPLVSFPEKERRLWQSFEASKFELEFACVDLSFEEVQQLLDIGFYIQKRQLRDTNIEEVIDVLVNDKVLVQTGNKYNITNLGAYTLARNMKDFPQLQSRTIRVTKYAGNQPLSNAVSDRKGTMGIAVSFDNLIKSIMAQLPFTEDYSKGSRIDVPIFPQIAIRELVANALVHQDFTITGSRPFVEIFDSRIEISNPGTPLIDPRRFLDFKPKSRNDELANLLGSFHIVESRGSGIDKVVNALEIADLPAMNIKAQSAESTVVTLHGPKKFSEMSVTEKNQSIYWHACLKYVADEQINNTSLRE
ncbi:ATP-binding protein [Loigolactobacillus bifermentans]|uniref:Transcriptional regulator n=1 Tax=Loigolactobacillus bifermentans DSM 20003 TaxID=1423726 RepID=A0A0R1H9A5_9LACO|nr:ATP-binding protein [Loigolactobacillus bifermentans]KRK40513.1 transcriptional regulator [Loigolactobacillus bifermentans DSM 20003]